MDMTGLTFVFPGRSAALHIVFDPCSTIDCSSCHGAEEVRLLGGVIFVFSAVIAIAVRLLKTSVSFNSFKRSCC